MRRSPITPTFTITGAGQQQRQHDRVVQGRGLLLADEGGGGGGGGGLTASIQRTLEQRRKEAAKSAKVSGRERR